MYSGVARVVGNLEAIICGKSTVIPFTQFYPSLTTFLSIWIEIESRCIQIQLSEESDVIAAWE